MLTGFGLFQNIRNYGIIPWHICQIPENEVTKIRKFILFFCALATVLSLLPGPVRVGAATLSSKAGVVSIQSGTLNVRAKASSGSARVASLKKGSHVTLLEKSGSWWKVEYAKGKFGYCHEDYISQLSATASTVNIQSGSLNVRSGAGTSYSRIATLSKGEVVLVLSASKGWSRILYHGTKTGYVSSQYLSQKYPAVSLNVPSFKQTDSRWKDLEVSQSGKTMSQIGCATTAIAMMESFRLGKTIYPNEMMESLRYTPSGNVYWPSHYTTVTDSENYLERIYAQLKEGKPVLFGSRNQYGSQHWVVIRGYSGGNELTASGFQIHDPGTASRTNLQQFLNAYPNFYKYFYA